MRTLLLKNTFFLTLLLLISCGNSSKKQDAFAKISEETSELRENKPPTNLLDITPAAQRTELYLSLLKGKKVGVITNQSGRIYTSIPHDVAKSTHLVDSLKNHNINIIKVYSPEHGFRGDADAGEKVKDGKDPKTGLPIISLHGKNKKPSQEQLKDIDVLLFDIQDVGVRFYTYISTLTYVMEAAAEKEIPVIVLDRPNPNGHYIDGPTLETAHSSFLGMHAVPLVYGMTIGEYATMTNGEGWLSDNLKCDLTVIPLEHWTYTARYSLPTRPSPNLPNEASINLYPSLGFFEGTHINAGRGTEMQFQIFGASKLPKEKYPFTYTPQPNFGSKDPKEKGKLCHGLDLRKTPYMSEVDLNWLVQAYANFPDKAKFFKTKSFTLHAGSESLQQDIMAGKQFNAIREGWAADIEAFKKVRSKYLIYN